MTGRIGKITADPEVRRAKNGDTDVLMLTVRFSDGGTASVQWMPGAGEDTAPQRGDIVAVERYGGVLVAVAAKSPGDPARKPGERELYSRTPAGTKSARIVLDEKVYIGNLLTDLCTVMLGLIDQIENIVTAGTPVSQEVSPPSKAALELYKQVVESLLAKEA